MSDIQFMEKPDWVSWEEICECFQAANTVNYKKGFHMIYSDLTPDELEKSLKEGNGHCFVALVGKTIAFSVTVFPFAIVRLVLSSFTPVTATDLGFALTVTLHIAVS